jgi:hypothetical protein
MPEDTTLATPGMSNTEFVRRFGWLEERLGRERWLVVYLSGDTAGVAYDRTRVSDAGTRTYVWTRWDFRQPQRGPDGSRYTHYLKRQLVDCDALASADYSMVVYDTRGSVVHSHTESYPQMEPAIPGSVGEAILEGICDDLLADPDS